MKNRIVQIFIFLLLIVAFKSDAQQRTLWSQHVFNDFAINPAVAGAKEYVPVHISARRQWMGIKDAPVAQVISSHGYIGYNLGLGGLIINESAGPTRRIGINIAGTYHLQLTKNRGPKDRGKVLSFGIAGSLSQSRVDKSVLTTYEPDDQAILRGYDHSLIPDAHAGLYFHDGNKYYVGLSVYNLVQSKTDLSNVSLGIVNNLVRTYYLMGGYNWELNPDFNMQPSLIMRMIEATPFQFDFQYRFLYKKLYWATVGYRHLDAVIVGAGFQVNVFRFGYTYDAVISDIRKYSSGSHEFSLTLMFLSDHIQSIGRPGDRIYRKKEFRPAIIDF